MDSVTDFPMRAVQGEFGAFTFAVSEFVRVTDHTVPGRVFVREVPELLDAGRTITGLPVQVQLLGGRPEAMATSALEAVQAGAHSIDLNFGCPAPTVNKSDGGASILRTPCRVKDIVGAVRAAVPRQIPVSAKVRLGWSEVSEIDAIADMAIEGGADWLTIHARTKEQRYQPPIYWERVGEVRRRSPIPVVANGDIWSLDDFKRCREVTGCEHFMVGRGALANPGLATAIAAELDLPAQPEWNQWNWESVISRLAFHSKRQRENKREKTLHRLKQWLNFAARFGGFDHFDAVKRVQDEDELLRVLRNLPQAVTAGR